MLFRKNRCFPLWASLYLLSVGNALVAGVDAPTVAMGANPGRVSRPYEHTIMHPDEVTLRQRQVDHENLPVFKKDPTAPSRRFSSALGASEAPSTVAPAVMDLYPHLTFTPSLWDQGGCGSCWLFASSAMLEVAMSYNYGIKDYLSTQYVLSNINQAYPGLTLNGCNGGGTEGFAAVYNATHMAVPASNAHAEYLDGIGTSSYVKTSVVDPATIRMTPSYAIGNIACARIANINSVYGTPPPTQAQVIQDLKDALNQGHAVGFSFTTIFSNYTAPDGSQGHGFFNFWDNQPESALWIDPRVPRSVNIGGWGSHLVVIMGYDESDPDPTKHYWIIQNEWGVSERRPKGQFRMPMLIDYNYIYYQFGIINLTMTPAAPAAPTVTAVLSIAKPTLGQYLEMEAVVTGNPPFTYQWRKDGDEIDGATTALYSIPYLASTDGGHEYDVVVTNSSGKATAAPVTFSVSGRQLLGNQGFESGADGAWKWTANVPQGYTTNPISTTQGWAPHLGTAYANLGGFFGSLGPGSGSLEQIVSIPAGSGGVSLGYWLQQVTYGTYHTWTTIYGSLSVKILDAAGNTLRTLQTYTNQQVDHFLWTRDAFDLSDFAGQTIRVRIDWNDVGMDGANSAPSAQWNMDDFSLTVLPVVPTLSLTPTTVTLVHGRSQAFVPTVAHGSVDTVTWSSASGGTLPSGSTPSGAAQNYTAPASGTTDTITASTVDAPVARATARVTLVPASAVAVSVSPSSLEMMVGSTTAQLFGANVSTITNGAVSWSGSGVNTSGLFSAAGLATGTYTITATSQGAPSQSGVATVHLLAPASITVSVTPAATLLVGGTEQFSAMVTGVSSVNNAVVWSVNGGGTITPGGLFTATTAGTYMVTATNAFSGAACTVGATVVSPGAVTVSVTPGTTTLLVGASQQVSATVAGVPAASNAVTWSVNGGGSITPSGLFTATIPGTYVITATNTFSGVSGTAGVVVSTKPTNLDLNGDGAVTPLDLLPFAKVYGTTNTSALFSGGSVVGDADLLVLLAGIPQ